MKIDALDNRSNMAVINVPANDTGATVKQRQVVAINATYRGPLTEPADANALMRVSVSYSTPTLDNNGNPVAGSFEPSVEMIEEWGTLALYINGTDVTYFRDAAAGFNTISWQRLGNYETAEFTIPAVTVFEEHGVGEISWLKDSASIQVVRVHPDGTRETIWLGSINSIRPNSGSLGVTVSAHGLLYDATYRLALPSVSTTQATAVQDIGYDLAHILNSAQGHWAHCEPVTTGVPAVKDGAWESGIDYIRALLGLAVTDSGEAWTVWMNNISKPSIIKTTAIPGATTATITAGQDGIDDSIARDTVAGITTIYGTGKSTTDAEWRNTMYPNATSASNRFPLDDASASFGQGFTDAQTASGNGVTALQTRLVALGRTVTISGKYDEVTAYQVSLLQKKYNQKVSGAVTAAFWNRLWNKSNLTKNAYIAPLAIDTRVAPRLYNTYGKDTGPNPAYDPSIRPIEQYIDFGDGVSLSAAKRAASAILLRDGGRPTEGDITLTVCPPEKARFDIKPGDTISYEARWGETVSLKVHRVEWSLSDVPTVRLTVSTRDMDYTELDAAMNRLRVNALSPQNAVKSTSSTASQSDGFGTVGQPGLYSSYPTTVPFGAGFQGNSQPTRAYTYYMRSLNGGTINQLGILLAAVSPLPFQVTLAVYSNVSGATALTDIPGPRIASTVLSYAGGTVGYPTQMFTLPLSAPVNVQAGDWLAVSFNVGWSGIANLVWANNTSAWYKSGAMNLALVELGGTCPANANPDLTQPGVPAVLVGLP